jgi:hypothetical protein
MGDIFTKCRKLYNRRRWRLDGDEKNKKKIIKIKKN